jgi:hypothetical protein
MKTLAYSATAEGYPDRVVQAGERFTEVAPSIYVADLLPAEAVRVIRAEFDAKDPWDVAQIAVSRKNEAGRAEIVGVIDEARRKSLRIRLRDIDLAAKPWTASALGRLRSTVCAFVSREFGMVFQDIGGAEIVHYPEGGDFKAHTDTHRGNAERAFTVILYLNDDFAAGATVFPNAGYQCQPHSGRVLVFPSTELHAGLPVQAGEKTILVFWVLFPGTEPQP